MGTSRWFALAFITLVVAACAPYVPEPREVRPETDVCPECRMTVVGDGHAAQAVGEDGTVLMFDDPGCLVMHALDDPEHFTTLTSFVQDFDTHGWVPWDKAVFVRADEVPTPMNYGWHAFGELSRAETFAEVHPGSQLVSRNTQTVLAADLKDRRWVP